MSNNKNVFFFILSMFVIIGYIIYQKKSYHKEINENKGITIGKINEYQFSEYIYLLSFEYEVNNRKYEKTISTSFFKCKNGVKGCVGSSYKVYYSILDPEKSDIDLQDYNKFKN